MVKRIITAVICLPLLIFFIVYGGWPLALVCLLLSLIGLNELYTALSKENKCIHAVGYAFTVVYYLLILYWGVGYWLLVAMTLFVISILTCMALFFRRVSLHDCITTVFGFFYVPFLLSFAYFIRAHEWGQYYIWLIFISSFGCDTFAYAAGMNLGKHKLVNTPSPKKSLEGVIGGIVGATLLGFAYGYFLGYVDVINAVVICFCGAFFSVIGDMSASAIKRYTEIKDFGKVFPGHGGVLDRFDSVLVAAPIIFLIMTLMLR
jgi:phosphatidate cytidylyltransferase